MASRDICRTSPCEVCEGYFYSLVSDIRVLYKIYPTTSYRTDNFLCLVSVDNDISFSSLPPVCVIFLCMELVPQMHQNTLNYKNKNG